MVIDTTLSTDYNYILNDSIQSTIEFYISQPNLSIEKYLQNRDIESKLIILNAMKEIEIEKLKKSIRTGFDEIQTIESVIELESDNNKVSLIFNTSLPNNLSPQEIDRINDKAFEIFSKGHYNFIDSVMVL